MSDQLQTLKANILQYYNTFIQWLRNLDGMVAVGLIMTAVLVGAVAAGALFPLGNDTELGKWSTLIQPDSAARAVLVNYDVDSGTLKLEPDPNEFDDILTTPRDKKFVRTHLSKFNQATAGRRFTSKGVVRGTTDCLFSVVLDEGTNGKLVARLRLQDLSAYNMVPVGLRKTKQLGAVHLAPEATRQPYFSDGNLGLFLDPGAGDETPLRVSLQRKGVYSAGQVTLTDDTDLPRATVKAADDGETVVITPAGEHAVFLDNNPPLVGKVLSVGETEIVEIGGRFFELHVADGAGVAMTRARADRVKRIYPLGSLLHIVGPLSLTGAHQSLGIEYMFQEYLMGIPEEGVPPGELWLTIDRRIQAQLAAGLDELVRQSRRGTASALIMDAHTGAIVAMAGEPNHYDPEDKARIMDILQRGKETYYNHGCFKRHVIGSTTKVFFGFMALQQLGSDITGLRVDVPGGRVRNLFGHKLYGPRESYMKVKNRNVSFSTYLIKSDNPYQHSLGMLLLSGVRNLDDVPAEWFQRNTMKPGGQRTKWLELGNLGKNRNYLRLDGTNVFAAELKRIFDIETAPARGISDDRDIGIYTDRFLDHAAEVMQLRNPRLENARRILRGRSTICAPETPRMELEEIKNTMDASNVLYGANRNRWTDVKMAESFSRIATGKRIQARLVSRYLNVLSGELVDLEADARNNTADLQVTNPEAFAIMHDILERIPRRAGNGYPEGTAHLLNDMVERMERDYPGFKLIAKTGTIDDGKKGDPDSRLILGTFGPADENGFKQSAYTFAVYLKNALDKDAVHKFIERELPQWWYLLQNREVPEVEPPQTALTTD
ncbi:MAG: penicillin-binding transpeptidase domain-containing protein [Acidobacteriota bacterium]|nr:penicillin-binding transpeptidase domain-containing protein [Acidobacteriota bacterium]